MPINEVMSEIEFFGGPKTGLGMFISLPYLQQIRGYYRI